MKKQIVAILFILFCGFFTIRPFFQSGLFPVHDDTQVARVFEMNKSLSDGMIPVRWVKDLGYGYGYPIFNFYAPLAYYVGGLSNFFVDSILATKIMMIIGILLSGVTMYFLSREFFGNWGGTISGIFYMLAPYHAVDIFVRGDVAEFFAYAFIPLSFYGVWRAAKDLSWKYVVIGSVGYAGVILSHNLTALMVTPFLLLFVVLTAFMKKPRNNAVYFYSLAPLLLGVGLSAFYFLPVLREMKYTNVLSVVGGGSHFADHFVCIQQLWTGTWNYLGSVPGCMDGMSFQIGKIHLLLFPLTIILLGTLYLQRDKKERTIRVVLTYCSIGFLFSLFLMLDISTFIWTAFPTMAFFQFPWRFLIMAVFFLAISLGSLVILVRKYINDKEVVVGCFSLLLVVTAVVFYSKYFVPSKILSINETDYTSDYALRWRTSKISDEYMPKNFLKPLSPAEMNNTIALFQEGSGMVVVNEQKTQKISLKTDSQTKTQLLTKIAPYPAWSTEVDGKTVVAKSTNKGYLISLPTGAHSVTFTFIQTPIERLANIVSLASILIILAGIIYRSFKYEKKR